MAYPDGSDLIAYCTELGVTPPGSTRADDIMLAVSEQWELDTGWSPFLKTAGTYQYDPNNRPQLHLGRGLIELTSLEINGVAYTEGQDFYLKPNNAVPFTFIDFMFPLRGLPQAIEIVGDWGRIDATDPTAAITQALLDKGAEKAAIITGGAGGPVTQLRQGDVSIAYGSGESSQQDELRENYESLVKRYLRREI